MDVRESAALSTFGEHVVTTPDRRTTRLLYRRDHESVPESIADITRLSVSSAPVSPTPLPAPVTLTLAGVAAQIHADGSLIKRRRQEVCSACGTIARAMGLQMQDVPAHPGFIRNRLKGFVPSMLSPRVSTGRWRNVLSLVRFGLKHVGVSSAPGRYSEPLAPAWSAILGLLDNKRRFGLSGLGRFCTQRGLSPAQVDDAVLSAFLAHLEETTINKTPRETHRTACVVWNRAVDTIPNWPQQRLDVPNYRRTYAIPWAVFAPSLKADVDAYLAHLAGTDILDGHDFRPLRPISVRCRARELHEFASAVAHRGRNPWSLTSLKDLVEIETVREGLRFFLDRGKGKKLQARRMAGLVMTVAKHWVRSDTVHLEMLKAICKRLDSDRSGMTEKNKSRLLQLDDPQMLDALINMPQRLVAKASRAKTPFKKALLVQTAVSIEILLMVPLRIENLAHLAIDRHLIRIGDGGYRFAIPAAEVKNEVDLDLTLPPESAALIDRYIKHARPLLTEGTGSWLFPGRKGPKVNECLGRQITQAIKRECGMTVNPHLFRHIAAHLYLKANPGDYGTVRMFHGHKSMDTTTKYYCGMENEAAFERYDDHILGLRSASRDGRSKRAIASRRT
jgi:integrase